MIFFFLWSADCPLIFRHAEHNFENPMAFQCLFHECTIPVCTNSANQMQLNGADKDPWFGPDPFPPDLFGTPRTFWDFLNTGTVESVHLSSEWTADIPQVLSGTLASFYCRSLGCDRGGSEDINRKWATTNLDLNFSAVRQVLIVPVSTVLDEHPIGFDITAFSFLHIF